MITKLIGSPTFCNTYILGDYGEECVLIDPGDNKNNRIDHFIDKHFKKLSAILLTHGHFDHIYGLKNLEHKAPVYIGQEDEKCLTNPKYNLCPSLSIEDYKIETIFDGEKISFGKLDIFVIATPFHTSGSVCFYLKSDNALLSGDSLFHLSYGRTDLPGGDDSMVFSSLKKISALPSSTKIYPGHGEMTILENEIKFNPGFCFLRK